MKTSILIRSMLRLNRISIDCRVFLLLFATFVFLKTALAQEKIGNEFRLTFVPTYAINKKIFLTTYVGYVFNGGSNTNSFYLGAPLLLIYKPNKVVELQVGNFLIGSFSKTRNDNLELRPLAGIKLSVPNPHHINLYNWTRYELRTFFYKESSLNNIKSRIRNRIGIEFPITKHAWVPGSLYGLADFEFFYTFGKNYLDRFRQRFGLGYVIDQHWKVEFIYHIQMQKSSKENRPEWTDNIFRINFKWTIPHRKKSEDSQPPQPGSTDPAE